MGQTASICCFFSIYFCESHSRIWSLHCSFDISFFLILQAASMFKGSVPPVVPFSLGTLGFMTPFCILHCEKVYILSQ